MADGDIGHEVDASSELTNKKDLEKKFDDASFVGKNILQVADERSAYRGRDSYSMPMLNPGEFSREVVSQLNVGTSNEITEEKIKEAKQASISLTVEAALQVLESQAPGGPVIENAKSVRDLLDVLSSGHGLIIQTESSDPKMVIRASRSVLEKRQNDPDFINYGSWDDNNVTEVTHSILEGAGIKLGKIIDRTNAVHGW